MVEKTNIEIQKGSKLEVKGYRIGGFWVPSEQFDKMIMDMLIYGKNR
jgi:hypothetical protein